MTPEQFKEHVSHLKDIKATLVVCALSLSMIAATLSCFGTWLTFKF